MCHLLFAGATLPALAAGIIPKSKCLACHEDRDLTKLIVHSEEALLAAAFILTIHFLNTHFRLKKFPMATVIFSGRISKTEMLHERRRWYDRLVAEDRLEWHRVRTNGRAGRASRVRWVICFSAPVSFSCA